MASLIQAWSTFGPRLVLCEPIAPEDVIERLMRSTHVSRGIIVAVLTDLDVLIEQGLAEGRIVQLPNGTHYRPSGKRDGSVKVHVRVAPGLTRRVNARFHGQWLNAENAGLSGDEIVALWNEAHPEDPVV